MRYVRSASLTLWFALACLLARRVVAAPGIEGLWLLVSADSEPVPPADGFSIHFRSHGVTKVLFQEFALDVTLYTVAIDFPAEVSQGRPRFPDEEV